MSRLGADKMLRRDAARTADQVNQRDIPYTTMPCSVVKLREGRRRGSHLLLQCLCKPFFVTTFGSVVIVKGLGHNSYKEQLRELRSWRKGSGETSPLSTTTSKEGVAMCGQCRLPANKGQNSKWPQAAPGEVKTGY